MYYIDTHVHLNDEKIKSHFDEVYNDAVNNNVKLMFVVGWDVDSSIDAIKLAHQYDNIYAIIGFHPCNIRGYTDSQYQWLEEAAKDEKVVAIGEIGFDLHWDDTTYEEQLIAFTKQIEIAKRIHKPISIHSREADQLTFDFIKNNHEGLIGGVLHCYSGSYELAKEYQKMNFIFGIGGTVTFKNNKTTVRVVENISLDYLITETDAPYLAPTPYRGEENGPKFIPLVVDKIAELKNINKEEVINKIMDNVKRMFGVEI